MPRRRALAREPDLGGRRWEPALSEDLLERILAPENLHAAWMRVKANKGAPGIDGITIEAFPAEARAHWDRTRRQLLKGTNGGSNLLRFDEPPGADPHAMVVWELGEKHPRLPDSPGDERLMHVVPLWYSASIVWRMPADGTV